MMLEDNMCACSLKPARALLLWTALRGSGFAGHMSKRFEQS